MDLQLKQKIAGINYISNEIKYSLIILKHIERGLAGSLFSNEITFEKILYKKLMNDLILNSLKLLNMKETHSFKKVLNILSSKYCKLFNVSLLNTKYYELNETYSYYQEDLDILRNRFIAHFDTEEKRDGSSTDLATLGTVIYLFEKILEFTEELTLEVELEKLYIDNSFDAEEFKKSVRSKLK
jgi:hypothetical protein